MGRGTGYKSTQQFLAKTKIQKNIFRGMINVNLEGSQYRLPEGWNEVSVQKFEKVMELATKYDDYNSEVEYVIDMLVALTDAPKEDLLRMTRASFDILSEKLTAWVNTEPTSTEKDHWVFDGVEYMPVKDLTTLSMGDNISLELMIKESNETNILSNILPILIRKVKKIETDGKVKKVCGEFNSEEYKETRDLFSKRLFVSDVIKLKSFF